MIQRNKNRLALIALSLLVLVAYAPAGAVTPPSDAELAADPTLLFTTFDQSFATVSDYTGILLKKEVLDGKDLPQESIRVNFAKPDKVRLEWIDGSKKGMWAVYNSKIDPAHFWAHDVGWRSVVGVRKFKIQSKFTQLFHPNRFVITDTHFGGLVSLLRKFFHIAKRVDKLKMEYRGRTIAPVAGVKAFHVHAELSPDPRDGILCQSADIYMDVAMCMPINVTMWGWKGEMIGRYVERDLRYNVGIAGDQFQIDP